MPVQHQHRPHTTSSGSCNTHKSRNMYYKFMLLANASFTVSNNVLRHSSKISVWMMAWHNTNSVSLSLTLWDDCFDLPDLPAATHSKSKIAKTCATTPAYLFTIFGDKSSYINSIILEIFYSPFAAPKLSALKKYVRVHDSAQRGDRPCMTWPWHKWTLTTFN